MIMTSLLFAAQPFGVEALEADVVAEKMTNEGGRCCVLWCYDRQVPVLDRVMRVYATARMVNQGCCCVCLLV